jgi:hypothetical protein
MRALTLWLGTLAMLVGLVAPAAAQLSLQGGRPSLHFPTQNDGPADTYKHLPYRDLGAEIRIELAAGALYDFDSGEVPKSAADYMQQAANLIFENAKGPVRIECHSDRGQKAAERCAAVISQWLITQERLTKVKFVTTGQTTAPSAPVNRSDPFARPAANSSNVLIAFAKK